MVNITENITAAIMEEMINRYEWGETNEKDYHSAYKRG